ncbi:MAG: DUF4340 domain-containing protein [Betaproteobacteria bacterium]|nr:DUF4340 domain-containing protein [Betaproteobacteria bacterium]
MSARALAILVVLLVALGGGALLLQRQEAAERPANAAVLGQKVFKDLKAAEVASIRIADPKSALTLERKEDGWALAERGGFPADVAKVRDFVLKAIDLKVGTSEPIGEKDRSRLQVQDPAKGAEGAGTLVEFRSADAKPLARLIVGKKYFSREPENAERAPADGRFVQRPDEPGTVLIVADPLVQASPRSADWIDRNVLKIEKVGTLAVRFPDGSGWKVERSGDNADWKLVGAKPAEKLEITRANAASYVLGQLELADVAPTEAKNDLQASGLDRPTIVEATTLAGVSYTLRVGKLVGENYYLSVSSSSGAPRDKILAEHVLLVPKSRLEDTLKPRAEMLAKKEDTKK